MKSQLLSSLLVRSARAILDSRSTEFPPKAMPADASGMMLDAVQMAAIEETKRKAREEAGDKKTWQKGRTMLYPSQHANCREHELALPGCSKGWHSRSDMYPGHHYGLKQGRLYYSGSLPEMPRPAEALPSSSRGFDATLASSENAVVRSPAGMSSRASMPESYHQTLRKASSHPSLGGKPTTFPQPPSAITPTHYRHLPIGHNNGAWGSRRQTDGAFGR